MLPFKNRIEIFRQFLWEVLDFPEESTDLTPTEFLQAIIK